MTTKFQSIRKGFTLVELTLAMMLSMAIGAMTLALFSQQLAFLKIFKAQNFLIDEAPIISMHVSKLVGKADRFSLHDTVADAVAGVRPRLTASPVLVMYFRQPDSNTQRRSIMAFQNLGTGNALYYYVVPSSGALGTPQWLITKRPKNVQFTTVDGLLRMQLTGPADELITYSGSMQQ